MLCQSMSKRREGVLQHAPQGGTHVAQSPPTRRTGLGLLLTALVTACGSLLGPHTAGAQDPCSPRWLPGGGTPGVASALIASPYVSAITRLRSGDIIFGGNFTTVGNVVANSIVRYNPTSDVWTPLGSGIPSVQYPDYSVRSIVELPSGDLIVGGRFITIGGVQVTNLARYSPATNLWSAFPALNVAVNTMLILPDGDVLIGGDIAAAGPWAATYIARLHPATNEFVPVVNGVDGQIYTMVLLPGGDVAVGGNFTTAAPGIPANRFARFNPVTGNWSALGGCLNLNRVHALALVPGTADLIVGGDYTRYSGGQPFTGIARYNTDNNSCSGLGTGIDGIVSTLDVIAGSGDIIASGEFTLAGGTPVNCIARYNTASGSWAAMGTGLSSKAAVVLASSADDIIVGGSFRRANDVSVGGLARFSLTTGRFTPVYTGATDAEVAALVQLPDGNVLAGGNFSQIGGVLANRLALYAPLTGTWTPFGPGADGPVKSFLLLPGKRLIAGGSFTTIGGVAANNIARYNIATGIWSALGQGVNDAVVSLVQAPAGVLVVGGRFTAAGGSPAGPVALYNLSTGVWSALPGAPGELLALLPGGDLVSVGRPSDSLIVQRYSFATGLWSQFGSNAPTDYRTMLSWLQSRAISIIVEPNGDVTMNGEFHFQYRYEYYPLAHYSAATDSWTGTWGEVGRYAMLVLPDGRLLTGAPGTINDVVLTMIAVPTGGDRFDLLIGGRFTRINSKICAYFARYTYGGTRPVISQQPVSISRSPAGAIEGASFQVVTATPGTWQYQWQVESPAGSGRYVALSGAFSEPATGLEFDVAGADTAQLSISNPRFGSHPTSLWLECRVSSSCDSVTSVPASLSVPQPCSLADVHGVLDPDGNCGDGVVDGSDFVAFMNSFVVGDLSIDPLADVAGGGDSGLSPDGIIDGTDFLAFTNAFAAGC